MEDKFYYIMLIIMSLLEIGIIVSIVVKIRHERIYIGNARKMSAVVISATHKRMISKLMMYNFVVKGEDGNSYDIMSSNIRAAAIKEGRKVKIYVPENAVIRSKEDDLFEEVCRKGEDGLKLLTTDEQRKAFNNYIANKYQPHVERPNLLDEGFQPFLMMDGGGQRGEIIILIVAAAVIAVAAVLFFIANK